MPNKAWKQFEREAAALFGAKRFPANMGGEADFVAWDGRVVGQCKEVKNLSLNSLTALAERIEIDSLGVVRIGVVCVKARAGRGNATAPLVVMTFESFGRLLALLEEAKRR